MNQILRKEWKIVIIIIMWIAFGIYLEQTWPLVITIYYTLHLLGLNLSIRLEFLFFNSRVDHKHLFVFSSRLFHCPVSDLFFFHISHYNTNSTSAQPNKYEFELTLINHCLTWLISYQPIYSFSLWFL